MMKEKNPLLLIQAGFYRKEDEFLHSKGFFQCIHIVEFLPGKKLYFFFISVEMYNFLTGFTMAILSPALTA
jgi:hypothetical protein